jgi:putative endonuclease
VATLASTVADATGPSRSGGHATVTSFLVRRVAGLANRHARGSRVARAHLPSPPMPRDTRRSLGALGERLAVCHLEAAGYTVVDRNFRTRHGELDLVVRDERFLVFAEVKARIVTDALRSIGPLAAVGGKKRRRLRLMAREWLASAGAARARPLPAEIRFDAIAVVVNGGGGLLALDHVEDAF